MISLSQIREVSGCSEADARGAANWLTDQWGGVENVPRYAEKREIEMALGAVAKDPRWTEKESENGRREPGEQPGGSDTRGHRHAEAVAPSSKIGDGIESTDRTEPVQDPLPRASARCPKSVARSFFRPSRQSTHEASPVATVAGRLPFTSFDREPDSVPPARPAAPNAVASNQGRPLALSFGSGSRSSEGGGQ